jgi:hypothetical protein
MDIAQPLQVLMNIDHSRLDSLLRLAAGPSGHIAPDAFAALRQCLILHLAVEEDVLFPLAGSGVDAERLVEQLRADHDELRSLLEQAPTPELINQLQEAMVRHAECEDGPTGIYAQYDHLSRERRVELVHDICALRDREPAAQDERPAEPFSLENAPT